MNHIWRIITALTFLIVMAFSASVGAAEKQGRHLPFTAEEDADGARFVWWALGKGLSPYRYVPAKLIPECGDFAPSPDNKPQPADVAWWQGFVALYMGDNAPEESNLLTGWGKMSLKDLQSKYGPVKWYRYLLNPPLVEPPKEKVAALDAALNELSPALSVFPPALRSKDELAAVKSTWEKAEKEFLAVLQAYPRSAEVERRVGELYRLGHNMDISDTWSKSEGHYKKAIALSPWSVPSLLGLGLLYVNTDFEYAAKAESLFKEAIRVSQEGQQPTTAYSGLFFSYYYQGRLELAIKAVDEYLELRPNDESMRKLRDITMDKAKQSNKDKVQQGAEADRR